MREPPYAVTCIGYGSPLADLCGCAIEEPGTQPCQRANATITQAQPGSHMG